MALKSDEDGEMQVFHLLLTAGHLEHIKYMMKP